MTTDIDMPRQHPRQEPVEIARRFLHRRLDDVATRLDLSYPRMLLAIAAYKADWLRLLVADIDGKLTRTPIDGGLVGTPTGELAAAIGIGESVEEVKLLPDSPTGAEILMLLGLYEQRLNGYLIDIERED